MPEISSSRYLVQATWDDVPHLTEKAKKELLEGTPPYLRDARSEGVPSLGAGAIYPIAVKDIKADPFQIPAYWKRCFGMDVGWKKTACIWLAKDPSDNVVYAYAEHYMGEALPILHAAAIKARGAWIPGAVDPASRGRSQRDGKRLFYQYADSKENGGQELDLHLAINDVEAGMYEVWQALQVGQLKIFSTLMNLLAEYRIYHRDERGRIVKENDHALDALRYGYMTFDRIAKVKPVGTEHKTTSSVADKLAGY